ncbi:hypothetical protein [Stenotrophomonas sp. Marseille-Q4652]|uniref:hypothetical protein n=1 Tax=Stenotrophomonas sp. Marseille-Q4652 TaxID=2866595 RepID=UPI001CE4A615|nr:hypothetical protein [Stenotrophomonas sp. Marseille-Q4652]
MEDHEMLEQKTATRFSLLRFAVVALVPGLAIAFSAKGLDAPRALFLIGLVLIAFFAGVFNPLSPTSLRFKPVGTLQWLGLWAAVAGSVLILFSLALRLG